MKVLVINGPNINMLGIREPDIYGKNNYKQLKASIKKWSNILGIKTKIYQSNHEGDIVDIIQSAYKKFDAIIINPAAYTHTSVAILDAIKSVNIPCIEVHLSEPDKREDFRHVSYVGMACVKRFSGYGFESYKKALEYVKNNI